MYFYGNLGNIRDRPHRLYFAKNTSFQMTHFCLMSLTSFYSNLIFICFNSRCSVKTLHQAKLRNNFGISSYRNKLIETFGGYYFSTLERFSVLSVIGNDYILIQFSEIIKDTPFYSSIFSEWRDSVEVTHNLTMLKKLYKILCEF